MNTSPSFSKKMSLLMVCLLITMLPGCAVLNWFKGKMGSNSSTSGTSTLDKDVLASLNGKSIITVESLNADFNQLLEENPQLKSVLPLMPDAKYNFLMGMVSQAVVDKYIEDSGIDKTAEYKKELENTMRSVKRMLNTKYFGLKHPVAVTDAEVKKFYEENKESMPDLLVSRGGVKAMGIQFDKEATAKDFLAKAKGQNFNAIAAQLGLKDKVVDFKLVNNQSLGVDTALRTKIAAFKKFPALEMIADSAGKKWVVYASGSEAPEYRPFEQVKAPLKQFVEKEKRMELFDKEINKLKDQYKVEINETYFKNQEQEVQPNSPEAQQLMDMLQQGQEAGEEEEQKPASAARAA
ncbi:MAG: peptidyl-prolyl cis-trans isomerase [Candidatus Babeliales bacterium]